MPITNIGIAIMELMYPITSLHFFHGRDISMTGQTMDQAIDKLKLWHTGHVTLAWMEIAVSTLVLMSLIAIFLIGKIGIIGFMFNFLILMLQPWTNFLAYSWILDLYKWNTIDWGLIVDICVSAS